MTGDSYLLAPEAITLRIATVRGQRVLLDADLAALYEVETKRFTRAECRAAPKPARIPAGDRATYPSAEGSSFNEAVKRNQAKFPADFMFALTPDEWSALRSQFATLNATGGGRGQHRKYLPYAFTEHGAIMAATLLSSPRAIEVSVYVVRAFVRMRQLATTHGDLAKRLDELEHKTEGLSLSHDNFSRNTRNQLKQVFDACARSSWREICSITCDRLFG